MCDYGKRWVYPFQYPVVRFSSCTFRVSVPIICDWYLQWVQFVSHPDRSWSPLTDCTGPIWLQESWTLVSALIHFHPLFWILLYRPGGCIADLLVLNSISWPYETVLCVCVLSLAQPFATPWTVALQSPSVHGIFQARTLEWIAISYSRGSSPPRDRTHVFCIGKQIVYHWST